MDDKQTQYWLDMFPSMKDTQISNLSNILETERVKLAELEIKYKQEIMALNQKYMDIENKNSQSHLEGVDGR